MPTVIKPGTAGKIAKNAAKTVVDTTKKVVNKAIENKKGNDAKLAKFDEDRRKKEEKDKELSNGKYCKVTLRYVVDSKSAKGKTMQYQEKIDAINKR